MSSMLMPPNDPQRPTLGGQNKALWRDVDTLWRRLKSEMPKPGNSLPKSGPPHPGTSNDYARADHSHGAGGGAVYVQPDEPPDVGIGTLWFDTDAGV